MLSQLEAGARDGEGPKSRHTDELLERSHRMMTTGVMGRKVDR